MQFGGVTRLVKYVDFLRHRSRSLAASVRLGVDPRGPWTILPWPAVVKANLAREQATVNFEFEVVAESGLVSVKGGILRPSQAKEIADIVGAVPGVVDVELRQLELVIHI
jgi:hypothetical protein